MALNDVRKFFGLSAKELKDFKAENPSDLAEIQKGIENGSLTY